MIANFVGQAAKRNPLRRALFGVGIVALWEGAVRIGGIRSYLLPAPSVVWHEVVTSRDVLARHALVTLGEAMAGLVLAAAIGMLMATLIVYSPYLRSVLLPTLVALNAVPKVAFAPLLIIWLGLGFESKVAMALLLSVFPIVVNTVTGLSEVEPELIRLFRLLRANEIQTFVHMRFPNALPAIFDGVKIALPIALVGAVVGEFAGSRQGLGYLVQVAGGSMNTQLVFAVVVVIGVLSVVLFEILVSAERVILRWRPSARRF